MADVNPLRFNEFAKIATSEFMERNAPLNETIAKIAEKNNLSPIQIQRVIELANLETNERLFKTAKDKTFTFPLASMDGVQAVLHPGKPMIKTSALMTGLFPSTAEKEKRVAEGLDKVAEASRAHVNAPLNEKKLAAAMEKLAGERRKLRTEFELQKMAAEQEVAKAYDAIKEKVRDHVILDGGHINDMFKYACIAFPENIAMWKVVFTNVKSDLMKLGHPVDKGLIEQNIEIPGSPVEVINGRHALQIDLDTFRKKISDTDAATCKIHLLDDAPTPTPTGTRSFQDESDVQLYLAEEIENLSKKASEMKPDEFIEKSAGLLWEGAKRVGGFAWHHPKSTAALVGGAALAVPATKFVGRQFGRSYNVQASQPAATLEPGQQNVGYGGLRQP